MQHDLIELLACPLCTGDLAWEILEEQHGLIRRAWACCQDCSAVYPVQDGIGVFLPEPELAEPWEDETHVLLQGVRSQPDVEQRLLSTPLEALSPVDAYYRALVLESQGDLGQARIVYETALLQLYAPEQLICRESQLHYLVEHLDDAGGPVLILSSGRAELTEAIRRSKTMPLIIAGASPGMLARLRRWLGFLHLETGVSCLACDPRQTPFKDGALPVVTTDQGLANQQALGRLLKEMRRVSSRLAAVHAFYPLHDASNAAAIEALGLKMALHWENLQPVLAAAGWEARRENVCRSRAQPPPRGSLVSAPGFEALPVAETWLDWCTLVARPEKQPL
jgi:uncharacterized protein